MKKKWMIITFNIAILCAMNAIGCEGELSPKPEQKQRAALLESRHEVVGSKDSGVGQLTCSAEVRKEKDAQAKMKAAIVIQNYGYFPHDCPRIDDENKHVTFYTAFYTLDSSNEVPCNR